MSTLAKKSIVSKHTMTMTTSAMFPNPNHGWFHNTEILFTNRASVIAAGHVGAMILMVLPYEEAEEIMLSWEPGSVITDAVIWYVGSATVI
jgi:hypothetical protein